MLRFSLLLLFLSGFALSFFTSCSKGQIAEPHWVDSSIQNNVGVYEVDINEDGQKDISFKFIVLPYSAKSLTYSITSLHEEVELYASELVTAICVDTIQYPSYLLHKSYTCHLGSPNQIATDTIFATPGLNYVELLNPNIQFTYHESVVMAVNLWGGTLFGGYYQAQYNYKKGFFSFSDQGYLPVKISGVKYGLLLNDVAAKRIGNLPTPPFVQSKIFIGP